MFRKFLTIAALGLIPVPATAAVYWGAPDASPSAATSLNAASSVKATLPANSLTIVPPADLGGGLTWSNGGLAGAAQWALLLAGLAIVGFAVVRRHRMGGGSVYA